MKKDKVRIDFHESICLKNSEFDYRMRAVIIKILYSEQVKNRRNRLLASINAALWYKFLQESDQTKKFYMKN
jgi:hypothetical protein